MIYHIYIYLHTYVCIYIYIYRFLRLFPQAAEPEPPEPKPKAPEAAPAPKPKEPKEEVRFGGGWGSPNSWMDGWMISRKILKMDSLLCFISGKIRKISINGLITWQVAPSFWERWLNPCWWLGILLANIDLGFSSSTAEIPTKTKQYFMEW